MGWMYLMEVSAAAYIPTRGIVNDREAGTTRMSSWTVRNHRLSNASLDLSTNSAHGVPHPSPSRRETPGTMEFVKSPCPGAGRFCRTGHWCFESLESDLVLGYTE